MNYKIIDDILNQLKTPRDISKLSLEEQASIITLFFIGYIVKPIGISDELLKKCGETFDKNRGKVEWEEAAVLTILKESKK